MPFSIIEANRSYQGTFSNYSLHFSWGGFEGEFWVWKTWDVRGSLLPHELYPEYLFQEAGFTYPSTSHVFWSAGGVKWRWVEECCAVPFTHKDLNKECMEQIAGCKEN